MRRERSKYRDDCDRLKQQPRESFERANVVSHAYDTENGRGRENDEQVRRLAQETWKKKADRANHNSCSRNHCYSPTLRCWLLMR